MLGVRELIVKRNVLLKDASSIEVRPSGNETQREERCYIVIPGLILSK